MSTEKKKPAAKATKAKATASKKATKVKAKAKPKATKTKAAAPKMSKAKSSRKTETVAKA